MFQGAMNSLNPVHRIGRQISDALQAHLPAMKKKEALERAADLLDMVGISPDRLRSFPHQLSGGMRQRVMIAMALALDPQVLIMDEPTTALDVVMQRQIVEQIAELRDRLGFSVIFITHDVSLLIEIADRIAIMYAGEIVEEAAAQDVYRRPRHPYSDALLHSFPPLRGPRRELGGIPGLTAGPGQAAHGLPVPGPLRARVRRLRDGPPGARRPGRARRRPASVRSPACCTTPRPSPPPGSSRSRSPWSSRSADRPDLVHRSAVPGPCRCCPRTSLTGQGLATSRCPQAGSVKWSLEPVDDHPLADAGRHAMSTMTAASSTGRSARGSSRTRGPRAGSLATGLATALAHRERATGRFVRAGGRRAAAGAARRAVESASMVVLDLAAVTLRSHHAADVIDEAAVALERRGGCLLCINADDEVRAQLGTCTHAVVVAPGRAASERACRADRSPGAGGAAGRDLPWCGERCPRPARAGPGPVVARPADRRRRWWRCSSPGSRSWASGCCGGCSSSRSPARRSRTRRSRGRGTARRSCGGWPSACWTWCRSGSSRRCSSPPCSSPRCVAAGRWRSRWRS